MTMAIKTVSRRELVDESSTRLQYLYEYCSCPRVRDKHLAVAIVR